MCRFFTIKKIAKGIAGITVLLPAVIMIGKLSEKDMETSGMCAGFLMSTLAAIASGYYIGYERKCPLPHIAENVEFEQSQVEGQHRQSISLRNL